MLAGPAHAALRSAHLLGHHWAGEEHLLLALLAAGAGEPAAGALAGAGVTEGGVRTALQAHLERAGPPTPRRYAGTRSSSAYHTACGWAHGLGLASGTPDPRAEHFLLALLRDPDGVAAGLIEAHGSSRAAVLAELAARGVHAPPFGVPDGGLAAAAEREAVRIGHGFVSPEHVLLALLAGDPDGVAAEALHACGITHDAHAGRVVAGLAGSIPPVEPDPGVTEARPNPVGHQLLARAAALAAGLAGAEFGSGHGLLAYVWQPDGRAVVGLRHLSTSARAVLDALAGRGVRLPPAPLPEPAQGQ